MRTIDPRAIKAHADLRFRSEYDYALFEYYRSAKVMKFLERAGVKPRGRALDMVGDDIGAEPFAHRVARVEEAVDHR